MKGHPPLFAERQGRLAPTIFRTENTGKSQPPQGLVDVENFSEIFSVECFGGKRNAPNLGGD